MLFTSWMYLYVFMGFVIITFYEVESNGVSLIISFVCFVIYLACCCVLPFLPLLFISVVVNMDNVLVLLSIYLIVVVGMPFLTHIRCIPFLEELILMRMVLSTIIQKGGGLVVVRPSSSAVACSTTSSKMKTLNKHKKNDNYLFLDFHCISY